MRTMGHEMDFGYITKVNEFTYFIRTDENGKGGRIVSPYNLVPTDDFGVEEVIEYLQRNPEKLVYVYPKIEYSEEALGDRIRQERDLKIKDIEWRVRRHSDEVLLGVEPTEDIIPVLLYIQALRDITKQPGFPTEIQWPEIPGEGSRE